MARPKEFQRDEALGKAVEVFWLHGFKATSMSDLQRATGIGRQSLYDTFGDKEQIFAQALDHYLNHSYERNDRLLNGNDGLATIRTYFETSVRELSSHIPRRACMIFNTCVELSPHDNNIAKKVETGIKHLRRAFIRALKRAKDQDLIGADADLPALAEFLTSQVGGLAIMAKRGASRKSMQAVANTALKVLEQPRADCRLA